MPDEAAIIPVETQPPLEPGRPARGWEIPLLLAAAVAAMAATWLPGTIAASGDELNRLVPWTLYAAGRLRFWEVPLWNPYAGLGKPLLALGAAAVFYPTILLHIFLPASWSWTIAASLKLFWAGCGTWLLARRMGLRPGSRVLAAMLFMLCRFNVALVNEAAFNVIAFLPWAVLAILRLIDRPTVARMLLLALILGCQALGGDIGASIHLLLTCALIWILHLIWLNPVGAIRSLPAILLAAAMGIALAGAQWMPTWDLTHSIAPLPGDSRWTLLWISGAGLLLALWGVCQKPARLWLLVGIVMTILAAFPAFRLMAATSLAAAMLGAQGLQSLMDRSRNGAVAGFSWMPDWLNHQICRPVFWIALALVELLPMAIAHHLGANSAFDPRTSTVAFLRAKCLDSSESPFHIAGDDFDLTPLPPEWATAFHLPDARADAQSMGPRWIAAMSALFHPDGKGSDLLGLRYWIQRDNRTSPGKDWQRVQFDDYEDVAVYENPSALPRAWLSQKAVGYPTLSQALARVEKFDFDPRRLVIGDWQIAADQLEWLTRPWNVFSKDHPTETDYFANHSRNATPGQITWLEDSPERVRLRITNGQGAWLVLADTYFEGWEATVNYAARPGVERPRLIVAAYGLLRALPLQESAEAAIDVTFVYRPAAWRRGLLLTTGAAAMIVMMMAFMMLRMKNSKLET